MKTKTAKDVIKWIEEHFKDDIELNDWTEFRPSYLIAKLKEEFA